MPDTHLPEATRQAIHKAVHKAVREALVASAPRVGLGYDVHRFAEGRKLVLGGVEIDHPLGLLGHSDADSATHAVIDAMLGAVSLGDIGQMFPDSDPALKGISSLEMLRLARERIEDEGYVVSSVDVVVVAEKPRLAGHVPRMQEALGKVLGLAPARISLKATTHEGLGTFGRGEGIAAMACATLVPSRALAYEELPDQTVEIP
ncbi:MAG: 2-C-methyl-D-erythritol 2,4-cyclodiphosphate synthase [Armatimonadetes bacterium]|nr:2-C-methyl-D-erythritol 2,4-cyclodiphosphate synthase [Armatimonadota bacterium]